MAERQMVSMSDDAMTKHTVFLSDWQVLAWLEGRLSVLFTPIRPQPDCVDEFIRTGGDDPCYIDGYRFEYHHVRCPFSPGDVLLGKETWGIDPNDWGEWHWATAYKADFPSGYDYHWGWRSHATMPCEAVRIHMPVTGVSAVMMRDTPCVDAENAGILASQFPYNPYAALCNFQSDWQSHYGSRYPWDTTWAWRAKIARSI